MNIIYTKKKKNGDWLYLICPSCGWKEEQPFDVGDKCYCDDKFIERNL